MLNPGEDRSFGVADEFGLDFDGGGDEVGDFDYEALLAGSAQRQQASAVAVERTADDADLLAVHFGRDFFKAVVADVVGEADSLDEPLHVGVAYAHGLADALAAAVAELQRRDDVKGGAEAFLVGADEQQVGYDGYLPADAPAAADGDLPAQRREDFEAAGGQFGVAGRVRIAAPEIAQHVPFHLVHDSHFLSHSNSPTPARAYNLK